jgi:hypothetical protein
MYLNQSNLRMGMGEGGYPRNFLREPMLTHRRKEGSTHLMTRKLYPLLNT